MSALPANGKKFQISPQQISSITGAPCENAAFYWPLINNALEAFGIADRLTAIAAIATVAVETPSFKPVDLMGSDAYFNSLYGKRKDLGNVYPEDGAKFHGRGFIQLTGRSNYEQFGKIIGIDLVDNPNAALDPKTAASILALYFKTRGVVEAARAQDWQKVRLLVNGGLNGWPRFHALVQRLLMVT